MSGQELLKLKAERDQLRRVFSTVYYQIIEMAKSDIIVRDEFTEKYAKAEDKAQRLFKIDEQVSEILFLTDRDENEVKNEFDNIEEYREKWLDIVSVHRKVFQENSRLDKVDCGLSDYSSSTSTSLKEHKRNYRSPKTEPPEFDEELKNWTGFNTKIKNVHEDNDLDEEYKFQNLLQSNEDVSLGRELVNSSKDYSTVEEVRIGGNGDLMKRLHVRELLKLILNQGSKYLSLQKLYEKLETSLRSLESLGVPSEQFDYLLYPLVESALPEYILREWEIRRSVNESMLDKLEDLMSFVKHKVECEERLTLTRSPYREYRAFNQRAIEYCSDNSMGSRPHNMVISSASTNSIDSKSNFRIVCLFCKAQHGSESCHKAIGMPVEKINTIVKNKGACFKCFKIGHNVRYCRAKMICIVCGGRHNPLMCKNRGRKLEEKKEAEYDVMEHSLSNSYINSIQLQTLVVTIKGKIERNVRVLVDTNSQKSYVTRKLVNIMGYEPENEVRLALMEDSMTDQPLHRCYKVHLSDLNSSYSCNFIALDTEIICQNAPLATAGPWVQELERLGVVISESNEVSVDLMIGADVAGKLLSGRRKVLSSGLVAVETFLGWTVMGTIRDEASTYISYINSTQVEVSNRGIIVADADSSGSNEIVELSKWWDNPMWFKLLRMSGIVALKLLHTSGFLPNWNWKKSSKGRSHSHRKKEIDS